MPEAGISYQEAGSTRCRPRHSRPRMLARTRTIGEAIGKPKPLTLAPRPARPPNAHNLWEDNIIQCPFRNRHIYSGLVHPETP